MFAMVCEQVVASHVYRDRFFNEGEIFTRAYIETPRSADLSSSLQSSAYVDRDLLRTSCLSLRFLYVSKTN